MSDDTDISQAAAIPVRRRDGSIEFCLITSASGRRWTIPKGIIDPGETAKETAAKEALEEAGLYGRIVGGAVGHYQYRKWGRELTVEVFVLEVTHEAEEWEEMNLRDRIWVSSAEVAQLIADHPALQILNAVVDRTQNTGT